MDTLHIETCHSLHNFCHSTQWLTLALICLTQTAFIPYLTDMTSIGMAATAEGSKAFYNMFDPNDVSSADVKFAGAMGIMGVNAYGFAFTDRFETGILMGFNPPPATSPSGALPVLVEIIIDDSPYLKDAVS